MFGPHGCPTLAKARVVRRVASIADIFDTFFVFFDISGPDPRAVPPGNVRNVENGRFTAIFRLF